MNIGFFFMHPSGESMGSLYRVKNLCLGLTKLSHKIFFFTPFNFSEDWGPLVKFITIPLISSEKGGHLSKLIYNIARWILNIRFLSNITILIPKIFNITINRISNGLFNVINENSIPLDVIIGETEIGGLVLTRIKNKLKIPIIVDYHNYWPEELVEHGIIKRDNRRYNYLINLEKKIIKAVDLVYTVSEPLKNFLIKQFNIKDQSKIIHIHIGGVPVLDKPKKKEFPPKIINAGGVVHRSNMKLFLKSMTYVLEKYPKTKIYITKKGEKLVETMNLARKMNINVNFYWKNSYKEFIELLSDCHVGVVTSSYDLSRKLGFVTKIYDYFSVGIPVVGNDIGGWSPIITNEKVGLLSSKEPKDLAKKIIYLIENPEIAYEHGVRGIQLLKDKYNLKTPAQNIIKSIENIL